jgi:hypothetical protein
MPIKDQNQQQAAQEAQAAQSNMMATTVALIQAAIEQASKLKLGSDPLDPTLEIYLGNVKLYPPKAGQAVSATKLDQLQSVLTHPEQKGSVRILLNDGKGNREKIYHQSRGRITTDKYKLAEVFQLMQQKDQGRDRTAMSSRAAYMELFNKAHEGYQPVSERTLNASLERDRKESNNDSQAISDDELVIGEAIRRGLSKPETLNILEGSFHLEELKKPEYDRGAQDEYREGLAKKYDRQVELQQQQSKHPAPEPEGPSGAVSEETITELQGTQAVQSELPLATQVEEQNLAESAIATPALEEQHVEIDDSPLPENERVPSASVAQSQSIETPAKETIEDLQAQIDVLQKEVENIKAQMSFLNKQVIPIIDDPKVRDWAFKTGEKVNSRAKTVLKTLGNYAKAAIGKAFTAGVAREIEYTAGLLADRHGQVQPDGSKLYDAEAYTYRQEGDSVTITSPERGVVFENGRLSANATQEDVKGLRALPQSFKLLVGPRIMTVADSQQQDESAIAPEFEPQVNTIATQDQSVALGLDLQPQNEASNLEKSPDDRNQLPLTEIKGRSEVQGPIADPSVKDSAQVQTKPEPMMQFSDQDAAQVNQAGIELVKQYGAKQPSGTVLLEANLNNYALYNDSLIIMNKQGETIFKDGQLTEAASPQDVKELRSVPPKVAALAAQNQTRSNVQSNKAQASEAVIAHKAPALKR